MGGILNPGKKAAKRQAEATRQAAELQAANDRLVAQATQQSMETRIAQQKASEQAAALLERPQETVDVQVGEDVPAAEIDPDTGRRRTTRSSFQVNKRTSGLSI